MKKQQQAIHDDDSSGGAQRKTRRVRINLRSTAMGSDSERQRFRRNNTDEGSNYDSRSFRQAPKKKHRLRRTVSEDPRMSATGGSGGGGQTRRTSRISMLHRRESLLEKQQENKRKMRGQYSFSVDHSGGKDFFEREYSFWSSKPALAMFCFLGLAVSTKNANLAYGALIVFLYEVGVVFSKWKGFIMNHPLVQDCSEVTGWWIRYSLRQVERFLDKKDVTRKAAFGVFLVHFDMTSNVVGGYFQQRKEEVTKRTLAEAQRLRDRLHNITS
ncbi:expressed unknown protein [Seminavis robusta]|uniref:Uncharacterized protein n=1 Tax=Seminavis robusta TaxID=568900 RepID=A0A9N8E1C8_9STRA|nr:expressed unknown protein [Seminavis robusta]|eukprot:Sro552_g165170.1 n/a (271) ;mRNA; f:50539-51351